MYPGASMVIVGSEKWISGNQTSKHHLVRQFLKLGATIIYVENISMRKIGSGGSSDLGKGKKILQAIMRGTHSPLERLICYTPLYYPSHDSAKVRRFNSWPLTWQIRFLLKRLNMKDVTYLYFVPTGVLLTNRLGERISAYYIVDNFAAFDGVDAETIHLYEKEALRTSDLVFATATTIIERLSSFRSDIIYSPHGVEYDFFASTQSVDTKVPENVQSIKPPVIGFMGSLAGDSVDLDLIRRLAVKRPDWNFLLVGRISSSIDTLIALKNVFHVDARPYDEMPSYLKKFDVALIPFRVNDLTRDLNPIKLREYLAAGLPTVATRLPAMEMYEPHVTCVQTDEEWEAAIAGYLANPGDAQLRQDAVREESWENRAKAVAQAVAQAVREAEGKGGRDTKS